MYDTILRIYKKTHNPEVISKALDREWITEEQAEKILASA